MLNLTRSPTGKFISHHDALSVWLPLLLTMGWSHPLNAMLDAAAGWCDGQAAKELTEGAKVLTSGGPQTFAQTRIREAERWFTRKEILLDTARRLREVRP